MSTNENTKGPWEYTGCVNDELGFPCVTDGDGMVVCSMSDDGISDGDEASDAMDARAFLIAAAPELLTNERKNLNTLHETKRRLIEWGKSHREIDLAIEQTEAAIAKAEGDEALEVA